MRRTLCWLCVAAMTSAPPAWADCLPIMKDALRLVLVTSPDMASLKASLRRFARAAPDQAWHEVDAPVAAVVGSTGLGWGPDAGDAPAGEPRKHEGDKRTPAGLFRLGRPFGKDASPLAGYLRLAPGQDICVDDPASPRYGRIVSRHDDPVVHGEDMGKVSLYRRGFLIDYPVDAARRGGSCIFLHVWRSPEKGTVGCVALAEPAVATLQGWARPGDVIAILPQREADKVLACVAGPGTSP